MKYFILVIGMLCTTGMLHAEVAIQQHVLGSGNLDAPQVQKGGRMMERNAYSEGIFFTPQYMPGYPTAATIWPRVVEASCKKEGIDIICEGYDWRPEFGRGEYLFYRPTIKQTEPPRVVFKEVPHKPKKQ